MSAPQNASVNTSGYREVDTAEQERQQWMFRFLDLQSNMRSNQEMKAIAIERLGLKPGDAVLEVGCGLGDDVRTLAGLVGPNGKAVGLDPSRLFLDEAERRSEGSDLAVSWAQGDAHDLPFEDDSFDAARSERTFMHLADPQRALFELVRVVRRSGRIAIIEPDHRSNVQVTGNPELMTKLEAYLASTNPVGDRIGTQLPILFDACGLTEIDITPHLLVVDNEQVKASSEFMGAIGRTAPPWFADAREAGYLTSEEHDELLEDFFDLRGRGLHCRTITNFIVSGTVAAG